MTEISIGMIKLDERHASRDSSGSRMINLLYNIIPYLLLVVQARVVSDFVFLILVTTNRLYREPQSLHSYISDAWFGQ